MPADDRIYGAVKDALVKDGWTITDDPFTLKYQDADLYADLAAERPLAAQRGTQRIVVEIKSFLGPSPQRELQLALGQYEVYRTILEVTDPDRELFLAVSEIAYRMFFTRPSFQLVVQRNRVKLIVVRLDTEEVVQWIA